ncbi:serine/threonine-protein kinase ULK4-like [Carassius gibelio]|uniref:serine/threonine-protein kinase ULK4-like n=1 Tax=Carassius gibelio TaxID=101364 RepID=UPI002277B3C2|nr:serine/threonine-protein kinase ULK4-like [Carassius gibelio]
MKEICSVHSAVFKTTIFRPQVVTEAFLIKFGKLLVVDLIVPPLASLAFSKNVEWRVVSLRVLSEITLLLLLSQVEVEESERDGGREREAEWEGEGISSNTRLLTLISEALLPQYETLLLESDPVPVYALKLLVSLTEHSSPISRLVRESSLLPAIFQVIEEHKNNTVGSMMQNAMALLCNLTGQKGTDLRPFDQQGAVHLNVIRFDIYIGPPVSSLSLNQNTQTHTVFSPRHCHTHEKGLHSESCPCFVLECFHSITRPLLLSSRCLTLCVTLMEGEGVQLPFFKGFHQILLLLSAWTHVWRPCSPHLLSIPPI